MGTLRTVEEDQALRVRILGRDRHSREQLEHITRLGALRLKAQDLHERATRQAAERPPAPRPRTSQGTIQIVTSVRTGQNATFRRIIGNLKDAGVITGVNYNIEGGAGTGTTRVSYETRIHPGLIAVGTDLTEAAFREGFPLYDAKTRMNFGSQDNDEELRCQTAQSQQKHVAMRYPITEAPVSVALKIDAEDDVAGTLVVNAGYTLVYDPSATVEPPHTLIIPRATPRVPALTRARDVVPPPEPRVPATVTVRVLQAGRILMERTIEWDALKKGLKALVLDNLRTGRIDPTMTPNF